MRALFFLTLFAFGLTSLAQSELNKMPRVSASDLSIFHSELDSSAEAQIISDIGYTYFWVNDEQIENVFEKTTRLQILNNNGYGYATVTVPIHRGAYGVDDLIEFTATSYTLENGEVVKQTVDKKALHSEDVTEHWDFLKYTFPNIKEGSIVEYSFKVSSPYNLNLSTWYFQHEIPVIESKYRIEICPYYNYMVLSKGFMEYDHDSTYVRPMGFTIKGKSYQTKVYEWTLNNVPPIKNERFITTPNDYRMKAMFQLISYQLYYGGKFTVMTTWEQLIDDILHDQSYFGGYISQGKKAVDGVLQSLDLDEKTNPEKVAIIVNHVKQNYYWTGKNEKLASKSKKEVIKSKAGNSAEINLLLHSLFTQAGIESSPMLISTRDYGKVDYNYPFINMFNYVAVMVFDETGNYYVDATDPNLPLGLLPPRCINGFALQVKDVEKDSSAQFYPLNPSVANLISTTQVFELLPEENMLKANVKIILDGYDALSYRTSIKKNGLQSVYSDISGGSPMELSNVEVENLDNLEKPLILKYSSKKSLDKIGNKLFIAPFPTNRHKENYLKKPTRLYPVDYGFLQEEEMIFTFHIPEGYELEHLPVSDAFQVPELALYYSYRVNHTSGTIQVMATIKRGKTSFEPESYQGLKRFYDHLVKKLNESIVLKKI
ncbi:hypothetical protein [Owenweeksia hongkongensis]|uniref:hypothetical protein n=1 Tax=Owenweeksia hongkongensis TaxID=253245 RepID=UPI003A9502DD